VTLAQPLSRQTHCPRRNLGIEVEATITSSGKAPRQQITQGEQLLLLQVELWISQGFDITIAGTSPGNQLLQRLDALGPSQCNYKSWTHAASIPSERPLHPAIFPSRSSKEGIVHIEPDDVVKTQQLNHIFRRSASTTSSARRKRKRPGTAFITSSS
jgi:hypothetical protein